MKKIFIMAIALIALSLTPAIAQDSVTVSDITFQWEINGTHMDITLTSPDSGWVAVGFDPVSVMEGADFYIGFVKDGEVFLRDDYGRRRTSHGEDEKLGGSSDVEILGGEENPEGTTIRFRIPLDSGDAYDHSFVSGQEIPVIFASSRRDNFTGMHSRKGKTFITFDW